MLLDTIRKMLAKFSALLIVPMLLSSKTLANDSTAVLAAGGLRLQKSDSIAILSEKLRVSPSNIVVDYEMQNISAAPVETIISFPLPLLEGPMLVNTPIDVSDQEPERFVNFETRVNGEKIETKREIRAYLLRSDGTKGEEVTDVLRSASILASPLKREFYDQLANLPEETHLLLLKHNLLEVSGEGKDRNYTPLWVVEISFYSPQIFEPGKVVHIHHSYAPVVGRSLFGKFSFEDDMSAWCIDSGTERAVRKLLDAQPVIGQWEKVLERKQVDYILKTGANWAGPIRSFELTLAKDRPNQIVSLCAEGLVKISDTEFRLTRSNYTPEKDLSVLFFEPLEVHK